MESFNVNDSLDSGPNDQVNELHDMYCYSYDDSNYINVSTSFDRVES